MRKLNNKAVCSITAAFIGVMLCMSGCGASEAPTADIASEPTAQDNAIAETQPVAESETESGTEVESETEAGSETEAETETVTEAETEVQTEAQSETEVENIQEAVAVKEGSVSAEDYAAVVKGVTIPLGGDMRDYVGLLGEPDDYGAAKSCTDAGDDKVYTYGGTVIYTYITNGADIISLIEVTGSEALSAGIHVGSTKEEVIAAYGSAYTEDGDELLYETGDKIIGLQITDNKVSFMELFGE